MDWLMGMATATPLAIILVGAYFIVYSPLSWCVVIGRILARRLGRRELAVLALFVICVLLECAQYVFQGGRVLSLTTGETWGLARYFGAFAPLLWIWAAWAIARFWGTFKGVAGLMAKGVVVLALSWLFIAQSVLYFHDQQTDGNAVDVWTAARRIAPIIQRDYKGPRRRESMDYSLQEYMTAYRPVVFSNWGAAAWEVRGGGPGPDRSAYKGREDYVFARVGEGCYGQLQFDKRLYDHVATVRGVFAEWILLRRKGSW